MAPLLLNSRTEAIDLTKDDDVDETHYRRRSFTAGREAFELGRQVNIFDLGDDEDDVDENHEDDLREISPDTFSRNIPHDIPPGFRTILKTTWYGHVLERNICVQTSNLGDGISRADDSFLIVKRILQHFASGDIELRGVHLKRTRYADNMLSKKANEVYASFILPQTCKFTGDFENAQCWVAVPLVAVVAVRDLTLTNLPFPRLSFRDEACREHFRDFKSEEHRYATGTLVCRWSYTSFYDPKTRKVRAGRMSRLGFEESAVGQRMHDALLAREWRQAADRSLGSRYTYAEICAGAGGATRGALNAGLRPKFLLDKDPDAYNTLLLNYSDTRIKILRMSIFDFVVYRKARSSDLVEVLHISFPCQPHSQVHTVAGKNDDENIDTGYSVMQLIERARPRIVTFEQTSGLLTHGRMVHFSALIHQITSMGYSACWKILNCAEYANVQPRKRLFIFASAPGEPLPDFPSPTHGNAAGLFPFTTIYDVLQRVPRQISTHMLQSTPKDAVAKSPHQTLKHCITTNGGESDLHPSGTRTFNMQELAQLNDFSPSHKFPIKGKTILRKLIGNAVPSCVATAVFAEVVKKMRATDEANAAFDGNHVIIDD